MSRYWAIVLSIGSAAHAACEKELFAKTFERAAESAAELRERDSRDRAELFIGLVASRVPLEKGCDRAEPLPRGPRPHCFTGKMRVATPRGPVRIADLDVGDEVYSYDLTRGRLVISRVAGTLKSADQAYGILEDRRPPIEVTARHRFYAADRGFTEIEDIPADAPLIELRRHDPDGVEDDAVGTIPRGVYTPTTGTADVWEIELGPGPHNFFVEGILVHNVKDSS